MRHFSKTLSFPLAGIVRRSTYRKQERPYATPYALNVRSVGALERRERGGSRPGMVKLCDTDFGTGIAAIDSVTAIDGDGNRIRSIIVISEGSLYVVNGDTSSQPSPELLWDDGEAVLWDDGEEIVFDSTVSTANPVTDTGAYKTAEHRGKLYLADSVLKLYDPVTGVVETVNAVSGTIPTGCPLVCAYRDRLVLAKDHLWYACRSGDVSDWDYGAEMTDGNRAVAGGTSFAAMIGEPIKALIPFRDQFLVFACENSMWVLKGDPATGSIQCVSDQVGIIAPDAWAVSPDGAMAFLSNDGIYIGQVGSTPQRFSEERLPGELRSVDVTQGNISMAYSIVERGFHLFISSDSSWFVDLANKAVWKDTFNSDVFPVSVSMTDGDGLREVILGCSDGYLRKFSQSAVRDDGNPFKSTVVVGPFRMASDDVQDAMITELHGILADNSGSVNWHLFSGKSAEEVVDKSEKINEAASSGVWSDKRNGVARVRCRGPWFTVRISSTSMWSYEAIAVVGVQLGRLR